MKIEIKSPIIGDFFYEIEKAVKTYLQKSR